jgi:hypothetical protein
MSVGVDQELEQRLLAAQRATQAAEEKIQKLIDLVKKAREEEESVRVLPRIHLSIRFDSVRNETL